MKYLIIYIFSRQWHSAIQFSRKTTRSKFWQTPGPESGEMEAADLRVFLGIVERFKKSLVATLRQNQAATACAAVCVGIHGGSVCQLEKKYEKMHTTASWNIQWNHYCTLLRQLRSWLKGWGPPFAEAPAFEPVGAGDNDWSSMLGGGSLIKNVTCHNCGVATNGLGEVMVKIADSWRNDFSVGLQPHPRFHSFPACFVRASNCKG